MIECSICKEKVPNHNVHIVEIHNPNGINTKQYICGWCIISVKKNLKPEEAQSK